MQHLDVSYVGSNAFLTRRRRRSQLFPGRSWVDERESLVESAVMVRTDQAWLEGLGCSDPSVVGELRAQLSRVLARGFGRRISVSDRDDLVQESMLRIHQRLDTFRSRSRFTTWAAAIAVNCALTELRRREHAHVSLEDAVQRGMRELGTTSDPARSMPAEPEHVLYNAIRDALTPRQREALLAELGGLPIVEIARRLGSDRGAIYKLLHDARKRLRVHLLETGLEAADLLAGNPGDL